MNPRVAVIGGGWAGCAAALTLADAGITVTLYEAAHTLGGRARAVELEGATLDNGQHILLGAYAQTLALIERLHPAGEALWRLPLALEQPAEFRLACPRLPAPWHLVTGLLGAHGLRWQDKLAAARWINAQLRDRSRRDGLSVAQLTRDQPEAVNRLLWHALCVSALNTPPEQASAQVFVNVLRDAFGGRRADSDLLLARRDLGTLLPVPAAARVTERGGAVRRACRVTALDVSDAGVRIATRTDASTYSHVVLAVAPQHVSGLLPRSASFAALSGTMRRYRYQPIATLYLQFDPAVRLARPLYALGNGPAQFVFDRGQSHDQPGLLALVASTASALPADWTVQAERQLRGIVDAGPPRWRRRIVEKQATYACVPDLVRPSNRTAHPRVFLAGDYTEGPYPATLESATLSGVQSAAALLESL
ncbi:MAG: phytoene dehydrogenase [Thiobacillus sp. 65-29]|nr:MAG: phytoene dehydrogenase [Thiobacillus sp. 65-29]